MLIVTFKRQCGLNFASSTINLLRMERRRNQPVSCVSRTEIFCWKWRKLHNNPQFERSTLHNRVSLVGIATIGWTVQGSNPLGSEIFCTIDRRWGPPSLLCSVYWCGVDDTPQSKVEVKERAELYRYSPSGASWPVTG